MDTSQLYSGSNGGGRRRSREIETLSLEIRKYPRDLLHTFLSADPVNHSQQRLKSAMEEKFEGEIELNLGLSLGGRFGVDRSHNGLIRASSIAGTMPILRAEEVAPPPEVAALVRTASLPVETDEEWRRRKEMQTLRRMEAKRRRSEKQRNSSNGGGTGEERESGLSCKGRQLSIPNPGKSNPGPGLPGQCGAGFGSLQGLLGQQQLQGGSQGSGESYGGGSSGVSELESKTHQGSGSCGEARSPVSAHSTEERGSQEPSPIGSSSGTKHIEGSSKQSETSDHKKKEASTGGIEDMPCVFTIGDGPNGRKVDGILYKYGKGKEVRIMCVCHGSFFSPAEFVKHAGCSDVEHPLRHIVVNPSPSSF